MSTYEGTARQLRALRETLAIRRDTVTNLMKLGYGQIASTLEDDANELAISTFMVAVPCLVCRQEKRAPVLVGDPDGTVPTGCLCEECDARITQEVTA